MSGKIYGSMAFLMIGIVLLLSCFNDPTSPEENGAASLNFNFSWDGDSTASDAVEELQMSITSNEISDTIRGQFNYAEATGSFDKEIPAGIPVTITVTAVSADGELLYSGKTSVSQTVSQTAVDLELKKSIPRGPEQLQIPTRASDAITFQWQDHSSHEDGYIIYRSVDAQNYVAVDTLGKNISSYTDSLSLQNANIYHYRVYAFNEVGLSEIFCTGKVRYGNWAPVFSPAAPLSNYQLRGNGDTLTVEVMVTDEDSDQVEISYSVDTTAFPRHETISFENNVFTWGSEPGDAGQFTIAFIASDGNEQVRKEVTLSVTGVNLPPVLSVDGLEKGANIKLKEGKKLAFTVLADDPNEGQSVDFLGIEHAPWDDTLSGTGSFDRETGAFQFSPAFSAVDGQTSRILDTIIISAQDDHQSPAVGTFRFTIEILDSNSAPVWLKNELDVAATENEKVTVNFSELFDTDPEGDVVTFAADTGVIDAKSGNWYYTPTFNDAGDMMVTITAYDNHTPPATSDLTLNLSIAGKNRAPEFVTDKPQGTYVLVGDGDALDIATAATDSDGDSVTIWYELVDTASLPRADDISFVDNTLHWASATGDKGRFILHFFATDQIDTVQKVVEVSIDGANVAPEISIEGHEERVFTIIEGKTLELTFAGFDRNEDQRVAFTGIQNAPWEEPLNGSGSFDTTTKTFTYTPAFTVTNGGETAEFDSIVVSAVDDHEEPLTARLVFTVQVTDSNSAPQWSEDTVNVYGMEGELVTFDFSDVLVGDAEGDSIDFAASKGTIDNTTLQWSWQTGFRNEGLNYITISATDDHLPPAESRICLAVSIDNTNRPPVAHDASLSMDEDGVLEIVLDAEDADSADNVALEYTIESDVRNGTLTAGATPGIYVYEPNQDFWGSDSFSYHASDQSAESNVAKVRIQVEGINDAPFAQDDSYQISEGNTCTCHVLLNDSDVDGDELKIEFASSAENGTAEISEDEKMIIYTPQAYYSGTDSFTYMITDGNGETDVASVEIIIDPVNDAPEFVRSGLMLEVNEGEQLVDTIKAIDIDGTTPAVALESISPSANDWLQVNPVRNKAIISANPGHHVSSGAPVTFTIKLRAYDGENEIVDSVTVTVNNVNLPPQVNFEALSDGDIYTTDKDVVVKALAVDRDDGYIDRIEFYQNNELFGIDSVSPYSSIIPSISHGVHNIRITAFDDYGASTSKEIEIKTARWNQISISGIGEIIDYVVDQTGRRFLLANDGSLNKIYKIDDEGVLDEYRETELDTIEHGITDKLSLNPITGELYTASTMEGCDFPACFEKIIVRKYDESLDSWTTVGDTIVHRGNHLSFLKDIQIAFDDEETPLLKFLFRMGSTSDSHFGKKLIEDEWVTLEPPIDSGHIKAIRNHDNRLFAFVQKYRNSSHYCYMYEYASGVWGEMGELYHGRRTSLNNMVINNGYPWVAYQLKTSTNSYFSPHGSMVKRLQNESWEIIVSDTVSGNNEDGDNLNTLSTVLMYDTIPIIVLVDRNYPQSEIMTNSFNSSGIHVFPRNGEESNIYNVVDIIAGAQLKSKPSFLIRQSSDGLCTSAKLYMLEVATN